MWQMIPTFLMFLGTYMILSGINGYVKSVCKHRWVYTTEVPGAKKTFVHTCKVCGYQWEYHPKKGGKKKVSS